MAKAVTKANPEKPVIELRKLKADDIGKLFTRKELGLQPQHITGHVIIGKVHYQFVTIQRKYRNELHPDGVVIEVKDKYDPKEFLATKGRHIFVRFQEKGDREFEYIGTEAYICRYDEKRNKIFLA